MRVAIAILMGLLGAAARAQVLFGDDQHPYVLMPAEAISSGVVTKIETSRNGHLIYYEKADFPLLKETPRADETKTSAFIYSRRTKISKRLNLPPETSSVQMFGDDRHVYYRTSEGGHGFIDLDNGMVRPIEIKHVKLHYTGEIASSVFLMGTSDTNDLVLYFPDGSVRSAKIPAGLTVDGPIDASNEFFQFLGERKNGRKTEYVMVTVQRSTMLMNEKVLSKSDLEKILSIGELADTQKFTWENSGDIAFVLLESDFEASTPTTGTAASEPKRDKPTHAYIPQKAKIGPSEGELSISDRGLCVTYLDAGALLIREIRPIDPELAKKLAIQDQKEKLLQRAKQVGLGFFIYATDNEDVFPGAEGWENKILPYLKDRELMNGFNYTFKGGDINKVQDPSKTEMGFFVGPGGRAVVYMDGSSRWVANP